MVQIYISQSLLKEINKRLSKGEADVCLKLLYSLKENPYKGDIITVVGNILLKEMRFKNFRFYYIHSAKLLKIGLIEDLQSEIIKCIAMSDKSKEQQEVINKIKDNLKKYGFDWFDHN